MSIAERFVDRVLRARTSALIHSSMCSDAATCEKKEEDEKTHAEEEGERRRRGGVVVAVVVGTVIMRVKRGSDTILIASGGREAMMREVSQRVSQIRSRSQAITSDEQQQ